MVPRGSGSQQLPANFRRHFEQLQLCCFSPNCEWNLDIQGASHRRRQHRYKFKRRPSQSQPCSSRLRDADNPVFGYGSNRNLHRCAIGRLWNVLKLLLVRWRSSPNRADHINVYFHFEYSGNLLGDSDCNRQLGCNVSAIFCGDCNRSWIRLGYGVPLQLEHGCWANRDIHC